jgi:hypothetical protein
MGIRRHPPDLVNLNVFFTFALLVDFARDPDDIRMKTGQNTPARRARQAGTIVRRDAQTAAGKLECLFYPRLHIRRGNNESMRTGKRRSASHIAHSLKNRSTGSVKTTARPT